MKTRKVLAILALIAILSLSFATLAGAAELKEKGASPATAYSEGYDDGYYESAPTVGPSLIWLPISLIFGAIVASAMNGSEKASMKTVREQTKANFYFKQGGLNLNINQNIFLYKRTERTPLNQDQNMNGGMGPGQMNSQMGAQRPMTQQTAMRTPQQTVSRTPQQTVSRTPQQTTRSPYASSAPQPRSPYQQSAPQPSRPSSQVSHPSSQVSHPSSQVNRPTSQVNRPTTTSRPQASSRPSAPTRTASRPSSGSSSSSVSRRPGNGVKR
ncbi:MAG: hypothetical protein II642_00430 [Firmicutes bacterium]|nr:hypothetical protein [Bacillota bacterium]